MNQAITHNEYFSTLDEAMARATQMMETDTINAMQVCNGGVEVCIGRYPTLNGVVGGYYIYLAETQ